MTRRVIAALDSTPWRCTLLIAVALTVLVFSVLAAGWRSLWYDELFTLYVASEPSLRDVVRALLAGADTNPPLDYLLRHASLALFGSSPEAFRWPSAAAFLAGLFATYAYVRRRAPFLASAAAFLLPVCTAAVFYTYEGRAYALLFASAPIALWAWQRAVDRTGRPWRLLVLALALCLGPYSHYYGVLNFLPVSAGEAWRSYRRGRVDWGIAAAIGGGCLMTLGLLPFAHTAQAMQASFWASGFEAADLWRYYEGFLGYSGVTLGLVLAAAIPLAAIGRRRTPRAAWPVVPTHEIVAAAVLAMTPVAAFLMATLVTGALTSKYTIALVPGVAILAGHLLAHAEVSLRGAVATVVAVLSVLGIGQHVSAALSYRDSEPVPADLRRALQQSTLPVAFDSPHQFLQYVHYEPQLGAGRFFYPMDPATALELRGFNNDELALRGLAKIRPLALLEYRDFTQRAGAFLVMHSGVFWPGLVKALARDGYCLVLVARSGKTTLLKAIPGCAPAPGDGLASSRTPE